MENIIVVNAAVISIDFPLVIYDCSHYPREILPTLNPLSCPSPILTNNILWHSSTFKGKTPCTRFFHQHLHIWLWNPQGSVWQLLVTGDWWGGGEAIISKFADDTKLGSIVDSMYDDKLQQDINKVAEWADTRQMNFKVEQYEMMCFGRKNEEMQYRIWGRTLLP